MVGTGKIIAQRFGYVFAQEDAARVLNFIQHRKGVIHANFQMLRCNDIHRLDRLVHIIGHNDLAVGVHALAGNRGAGQLGDLHL